MNFINTLSYYINMIGIVTIVTLVVVIGVLYYFIKIKKVTAKEERIDTSQFRREDSVNYVPFTDVISRDGKLDGDCMVVFEDNCFVGGISVRGFDYPAASSEERVDAQIQSVQFFNVVEKPTSFRQSVRNVDLSVNIAEHEGIAKKLAKELLGLKTEYEETTIMADDYVDEPAVWEEYKNRMEELKRLMFSRKHQLEEVSALIDYMKHMSGDIENADTGIGQKTSQIMFSYVYNPDEYSQELTKEEIYIKAMEELSATAVSYGEALAACHFRSKRLTARELIGLMRKHVSPLTGENFDLDELLDSSYTNLFVSSDSLVEECKKAIGEAEYNRMMEAYQKKIDELLRLQQADRNRKAMVLKRASYEQAEKEIELQRKAGNIL